MKTFATTPRPEPSRLRPCALCGGDSFRPLWRLPGFAFVRCSGCGLVQQNPQPLPEAVLSRYDETYLEYEADRQFAYRDLELLALKDLEFDTAAAPLRSAASAEGRPPRMLDVGCATGAFLEALRAQGWEGLGLDACAPAVAYGRERYGLDLRARLLEASAIGEPGLEEASFDCVHASHLIEHLNEPGHFLDLTRRLLRPAGFLILTTPNVQGLQARLLGGDWRSAIYDHLYLFGLRNLESLLARHGYRLERSVTWGGWAAGLRPRWLKPHLDRLAKRRDLGDVMAVLARPVLED